MRKSLEDLIFMGKIEEEVKVFGKKWTLSTLSSGEQLQATSSTDGYDTLSRVNALKIQILARSLKKVEGIELDDVEETLEFINKMQMPMINELFTKYEKIQQKQNSELKAIDDIKN